MPPGYERRNFGSLAAVIGLATTGSLGQVRAYIKNDGARICVVLTVRRGVVVTCKQPQEQHCCEGPDSSVGFASCLPLHHASSSELTLNPSVFAIYCHYPPRPHRLLPGQGETIPRSFHQRGCLS